MKNLLTFLIVGVIILVVGVVFLLSQLGIIGSTTESNNQENTPDVEVEQPLQEVDETDPITVTVNIQEYAYNPSVIRIKEGDTITWVNQDTVQHNVSNDSFESPLLSNGETFSYTFETAGTFEYTCTPHPYMEGTVIVE